MTTDTSPEIPGGFWPQIDHQLTRIASQSPDTFDGVREILLDPAYDDIVADVNLNGQRTFDSDSAFFAGSGGDATLAGALHCAGWRIISSGASYYYTMAHPDTNETLMYIEGDVVRGDIHSSPLFSDD